MAAHDHTAARPTEVLAAITGAYARGEDAALAALVRGRAEWPSIDRRTPTAEDAEICRQARLAAVRLALLSEARVWRSRALSRMIDLGWRAGAASVLMTDMHVALAVDNDDYTAGETFDVLKPSSEAEAIVHELAPFVTPRPGDFDPGWGPTPKLIARFRAEKLGLLHTIARRHDLALDALSEAQIHAADEPRGRVKVQGGVLNARYLQRLDADADANEIAEATYVLARVAAADGESDLADWAASNARAMARRSLAIRPYELL